VRLGPNDISVTDPDGVAVISGLHSKCGKAEWYSNDAPLTSMHTTRDKAQHDRRRRVWGPAFTAAAIRGYEGRVEKYNEMLVEGLREGKYCEKEGKGQGKAVNVSEVFNWYSFDVMGDLAFGRSFGCLEGADTHWAIKLLSEGMKPAGLAMPSWFFRVLVAIPGAAKDYWRFIEFCCDQLRRRMEEQPVREKGGEGKGEGGDIAHYLIENFNGMSERDRREALPMLQGDSRLIIVAGSDTTAATLVYLFYWLAKDSVLVGKVREEIARCRNEKGGFNHAEAELLNGCIHEALRLNPPVPSGIFRKTPKEGVWIGKTFVPGNTTIQMPWYVMGRGEFCCSSHLGWSANRC
jgi:cytochrome P450